MQDNLFTVQVVGSEFDSYPLILPFIFMGFIKMANLEQQPLNLFKVLMFTYDRFTREYCKMFHGEQCSLLVGPEDSVELIQHWSSLAASHKIKTESEVLAF